MARLERANSDQVHASDTVSPSRRNVYAVSNGWAAARASSISTSVLPSNATPRESTDNGTSGSGAKQFFMGMARSKAIRVTKVLGGAMPLDEERPHLVCPNAGFVDVPVGGVDGRLDEHLHQAGPHVAAHARIHVGRDEEIQRHDGRAQCGGQVERPLVEGADVAGHDACAFRAGVDRLPGATEHVAGALEDAAALCGAILWHGEEGAHEAGENAERNELLQKAAQEEAGVRQAERNEHEQINGR